jgi:hypothetical protein
MTTDKQIDKWRRNLKKRLDKMADLMKTGVMLGEAVDFHWDWEGELLYGYNSQDAGYIPQNVEQ